MICPKCKSTQIRRSIRKGLKEGLLLRLALMAPYRCFSCGKRFVGFSLDRNFRRHKRHSGIAEFLGFHGDQKKRFNRTIFVVALSAALIVIATMLALHAL
jgi:hypothetical protein